MSKIISSKKAFTLVEVMIVIAIIALLAAIAIPNVLQAKKNEEMYQKALKEFLVTSLLADGRKITEGSLVLKTNDSDIGEGVQKINIFWIENKQSHYGHISKEGKVIEWVPIPLGAHIKPLNPAP